MSRAEILRKTLDNQPRLFYHIAMTYSISEQNRRLFIRNYAVKMILVSAVCFAAGIGIGFMPFHLLATASINAGIILLLFIDLIKKMYLPITYTIEHRYFIIKQNTYERLRISKDDTAYIDHYQDNSMLLTLKTRKKILIHTGIEHYDDLISELKQFCCFNEIPKKRNTLIRYGYW